MTETFPTYEIGDWVVHNLYGVGQIIKIEDRPIHGEKTACFRVETKDAMFWFPKDQADNPRIRPIATPAIIKRAIKVLKKPGKDIEMDNNVWRARIEEAKTNDNLAEFSEMIRDLSILETERKLNQSESKALVYFSDRLVREWSIVLEINIETVKQELDAIIKKQQDRTSP